MVQETVLANMDYIQVQFRDGLAVPLFLQSLVMPNITTFSLRRIITSESFHELSCDMPALIGIIQRSGGMRRIRRLEIDTSPVLDIGVLLELLPSLDTVYFQSGQLSDNSIRRLSSGKLGPRLCNIYLSTVLHDANQILSMVESRYQSSTLSIDSEQIEDTPCPFKSISIPCEDTSIDVRLYINKIKLLSEKCDASINLGLEPGRLCNLLGSLPW